MSLERRTYNKEHLANAVKKCNLVGARQLQKLILEADVAIVQLHQEEAPLTGAAWPCDEVDVGGEEPVLSRHTHTEPGPSPPSGYQHGYSATGTSQSHPHCQVAAREIMEAIT